MQEIKEQETLPFEEDTQLPEEITKYHKRIDDLLEDAEIEAEMEAVKKIRSKNSRMFSISMTGIALLGLVYFQVNHHSTIEPIESAKETSINNPETTNERFAKQVPEVEDGSSSSSIPIPQPISSTKILQNPFLTPPKTKSIKPPTKAEKVKKAPKVVKALSNLKPRSRPEKFAANDKSESSKFYIQAGAFGVRKNAESLLKQLKSKGFSPSIQTRSKNSNHHIITVGSFTNKKAGDKKLKELTDKGFNASYYKSSKNSFSLKVGQFSNLNDAQKAQDRLSLKGFLSESHKDDIPAKTYMVQLGVFPNREKARLTQKKLARSGFSKTFIR
jgi:cell division septation protein DedD